jgi:hypothetical protein
MTRTMREVTGTGVAFHANLPWTCGNNDRIVHTDQAPAWHHLMNTRFSCQLVRNARQSYGT